MEARSTRKRSSSRPHIALRKNLRLTISARRASGRGFFSRDVFVIFHHRQCVFGASERKTVSR